MATRGCCSDVDDWEGVVVEELEGAEMPFRSARIESARVMRGLISFSAEDVRLTYSGLRFVMVEKLTLCHGRSNGCNMANLPSWLRFFAVHM